MRHNSFLLIICFVVQLCNAQLNEIDVDSLRKDHQAKIDNKISYIINNTKYKDFILATPQSKYGIISIQGHIKRVVIPFVFSDIYYEQEVPYGKIDSMWYKVDKVNAKVYELSSYEQNSIKERYDNIEWVTNTPRVESNEYSHYGTEKGLDGDGTYQLEGRKIIFKPNYVQECNEAGIVVVDIVVDHSGKVVKATPGMRGTTNSSECLLEPAKKAALTTKFSSDSNAPSGQKGKIVYRFSFSD